MHKEGDEYDTRHVASRKSIRADPVHHDKSRIWIKPSVRSAMHVVEMIYVSPRNMEWTSLTDESLPRSYCQDFIFFIYFQQSISWSIEIVVNDLDSFIDSIE